MTVELGRRQALEKAQVGGVLADGPGTAALENRRQVIGADLAIPGLGWGGG